MKIVIATGNEHKKDEIKAVLGSKFNVVTMKEEGIYVDIVEDGTTFEENALIKARALKEYTEDIILADDSGLAVDTLDGRPGVYSARYAGENATDDMNNEKLLSQLKHVPMENRSAKFVCIMALILPNGEEYLFRGECKGYIDFTLNGQNGFGYDPLFIVDGFKKTFGELSAEEKNKISHRALALDKLTEMLMKNEGI
ncbi:XTP/dITP diphosphohydrolase [Alkalibaculum bacchi]|uniref:dITP/XTP pyrophosphatase n=1 Tax=Alkalibaculum bacchi TaxID=645887 RepID=A0A366IFP7_9FIRM|nr:XTP/dITP diphosphatase [Alkalibaculum bacchi]RBP69987.1 XTP/dITP diphosphohydrolase [Alkalibaculum bacchi]